MPRVGSLERWAVVLSQFIAIAWLIENRSSRVVLVESRWVAAKRLMPSVIRPQYGRGCRPATVATAPSAPVVPLTWWRTTFPELPATPTPNQTLFAIISGDEKLST